MLVKTIKVATFLGTTVLFYASVVERNWFVLRQCRVPLLPAGSAEIKILHIADLHMCAGQRHKTRWVRSLANLEPDFVVNTGDNLGQVEGFPLLLEALGPLLEFPGVFVAGSNDYYAGKPKNPFTYLYKSSAASLSSGYVNDLPTEEMFGVFEKKGWVNLVNSYKKLVVKGTSVGFVGVDDPHLGREVFVDKSVVVQDDVGLLLGVTHAPYRRVLDSFVKDFGVGLVFAGHTHGGQLRVPGFGALTSNCDLPLPQARGLSVLEHKNGVGGGFVGQAWLHVSAGLGTSRFAPVRFACRPEATLVTLCSKV